MILESCFAAHHCICAGQKGFWFPKVTWHETNLFYGKGTHNGHIPSAITFRMALIVAHKRIVNCVFAYVTFSSADRNPDGKRHDREVFLFGREVRVTVPVNRPPFDVCKRVWISFLFSKKRNPSPHNSKFPKIRTSPFYKQ